MHFNKTLLFSDHPNEIERNPMKSEALGDTKDRLAFSPGPLQFHYSLLKQQYFDDIN